MTPFASFHPFMIARSAAATPRARSPQVRPKPSARVENAALFSAGETVTGIVRSIESYGVFVELTPNLAGLAEPREGVAVDRTVAVYVKSIIPEKMKVKLIIIDAGRISDPETAGRETVWRRPPRYFTDPKRVFHIDVWRYSPAACPRVIETSFA